MNDEKRLDELLERSKRLDQKLDALSARMVGIESRFGGLEARLTSLENRFTLLENRIFDWELRRDQTVERLEATLAQILAACRETDDEPS